MIRICRIADGRHPIWDGAGAARVGGRWNSPGRPVIYGSLVYACALLERLAYANSGRLPPHFQFVLADVPDAVSMERFDAKSLPAGWDASASPVARAFGDSWLMEQRSAIMLVPSLVSRMEWNAVVNPLHPDAQLLMVSAPREVTWGRQLAA